jgi:hypothetical protein
MVLVPPSDTGQTTSWMTNAELMTKKVLFTLSVKLGPTLVLIELNREYKYDC